MIRNRWLLTPLIVPRRRGFVPFSIAFRVDSHERLNPHLRAAYSVAIHQYRIRIEIRHQALWVGLYVNDSLDAGADNVFCTVVTGEGGGIELRPARANGVPGGVGNRRHLSVNRTDVINCGCELGTLHYGPFGPSRNVYNQIFH